MADDAAISVAANAFAVIGMADVVFRSGKHLYDVYSRARNAPASMAQLLDELRASTSIIAHVRIYLHEFESSVTGLAGTSGPSLPQIRTILTLLGHEYDIMAKILQEAQASPSDGWLGQFTKNLKWAMGEQKLIQSCSRLQRLTASMTAALTVVGRFNDVSMRREIDATRADIVKLVQRLDEGLLNQSTSTEITTLARSKREAAIGPRKSSKINFSFRSDGSRRTPRPSATRQLAPDPPRLANTSSMMPDIDLTSCYLENLVLCEHQDESVQLVEPIYQEITMPLLLLKNVLIAAIRTVLASNILAISKADINFISDMADRLLAHAHEASAAQLRLKTKRTGKLVKQNPKTRSTEGTSNKKHAQSSANWESWTGNMVMEAPNRPRWSKHQSSSSLRVVKGGSRHTPWGILRPELVLGGDVGNKSRVMGFRFSFAPRPELSSVGVSVSYISQPLLQRFMWNLPPSPFENRRYSRCGRTASMPEKSPMLCPTCWRRKTIKWDDGDDGQETPSPPPRPQSKNRGGTSRVQGRGFGQVRFYPTRQLSNYAPRCLANIQVMSGYKGIAY